ncbi:MAG: peptide chain release factor 1 [Solitalea-like symbiont of Tyrophagus putrescentiae]
MIDKLNVILNKYQAIENELSNPEVIKDVKKYAQLNKEYKHLAKIVNEANQYINVVKTLKENKDIIDSCDDDELRELAKLEIDSLENQKIDLDSKIRTLLIPPDPDDVKNTVLEIRAGTGGDEAAIFAGDLYRMYVRYAEAKKWKVELVDCTTGTSGGYKEIILNIIGDDSYSLLKYESGVHRVQRVPATETQGRVHTSAASVVALPEADELDVEINANDVRKDLFCSSGPGGQSVNTTYSAVRLTHIPTGVVAQCQDEKSQIKNYEKAMSVLRSRIYEMEYTKRLEQTAKKRKTMVSTGDRSAKIRTYNYPQSRVTEHRIGLTIHNLQEIMDGNIQHLIDQLQLAENIEKMKNSES